MLRKRIRQSEREPEIVHRDPVYPEKIMSQQIDRFTQTRTK